MAGDGQNGNDSSEPSTRHDEYIPWSGDHDFMIWQRRKRTWDRWFAVSLWAGVLSVPAGWAVWKLTDLENLAVAVFAMFIVIGALALARRTYWEHTGN